MGEEVLIGGFDTDTDPDPDSPFAPLR